jgi:hypothetical protein
MSGDPTLGVPGLTYVDYLVGLMIIIMMVIVHCGHNMLLISYYCIAER